MEQIKIDSVDIGVLDQWFSTLVDTINYDLQQIEGGVPALSMKLTTMDNAPVSYFKTSLDQLVDKINTGFSDIVKKIESMEANMKQPGG